MTTVHPATMHPDRLPALDDPWRRMPALIVASVVTWAVLLFAFSIALMQSAAPEPELKPIEARIVEVPIGGLGGGASSAPAPAVPRPAAAPKPKPIHHAAPKSKVITPPVPVSPEGTLKRGENEASPSSGTENAAPSSGGGGGGSATGEGGTGTGSGSVMGSDASGARALYAPTPTIPDELRENVFQAVAVAHFHVSYEGDVTVTLAQPTPNPRLNQILIDTLKQWKFFPAMKEGVAIDSEFDVRIPVSVN